MDSPILSRFEEKERISGGLKKEPTKTERNRQYPAVETRFRGVYRHRYPGGESFEDTLKKQAVVNSGLVFEFRNQTENGFETKEYLYPEGIADYVKEILGEEEALARVPFWQAERRGKDREDKPEYKVKLSVAVAFSNRIKLTEYYHNSSFLEYGGAPDKAVRQAFVSQIDSYLKTDREVSEKRKQNQFYRCRGLSGVSFLLFLHPDLLRKPDEKGDQQQVYIRGDDRLFKASA